MHRITVIIGYCDSLIHLISNSFDKIGLMHSIQILWPWKLFIFIFFVICKIRVLICFDVILFLVSVAKH